jgi:hypothetical protein
VNGDHSVCPFCRARTKPGAEWCGLCHSPLPGDESSSAPESITAQTIADDAASPAPSLQAQLQPSSTGARTRGPRTSNKAVVIAALLVTALFKLTTIAGATNVTAGNIDPRGFRFRHVTEETGEPVRYNPCAPTHYVINPRNAPAGGVDDVHTAVRMTSQATGLKFVYDGTTDEVFVHPRDSYQPDRYGERWAPILISWKSDLPGLPAHEAGRRPLGMGGSSYSPNSDDALVYVSGAVTFHSTADLRSGFGGRTWGQVILHELGHVLGLDHFEGGDSVMHPSLGLRAAAWGEGDRAGLWELGVGSPCLETPALP